MRRLILYLFVVCILLEQNLNLCAEISTDEHETAHIKDSMNSISPLEIPHFPKTSSRSFSVSKDNHLKNGINALEKQSKNDFEKMKSSIFKAIININHSKSIDDIIKTIQQFPKEIVNMKQIQPLRNKFKKEFNNVVVKGKTVLQMARKLERIGKKKTKKQVAELNSKLKNLKKLVRKFTKKFNLESKKQREESMKIVKNHPKDINLFRSAKRNINMIDLLNKFIALLEEFPDRVKCFIYGDCRNEDNNSVDDNDADDEEEEEDYDIDYDEIES